ALRPDAAEQAREIAHFLAGDRQQNIAVANVGLLGRAAIGETDDDESAFHLGGVEAEPRPRRAFAAGPCPRRAAIAASRCPAGRRWDRSTPCRPSSDARAR